MKHAVFASVDAGGFEPSHGIVSRLTYQDEMPVLVEATDAAGQMLTSAGMEDYVHALPCFTPECRILTECGDVALADLEPGDRVVTRDHGILPVRWVGRRAFDWRALGLLPLLRPILIPAGALGAGLPARDVTLSPSQGVAVTSEGHDMPRLAPANSFLDRPGVRRSSISNVSYVQLLLDQHALVKVSGLWCESFRPSRSAVAAFPEAERRGLIQAISAIATRPGRRSARYAPLAPGLRSHAALA